MYQEKDPSSYSNLEEIITNHLDLNWTVDFESNKIYGSVNLSLVSRAKAVSKIVLDTRNINVQKVVDTKGAELKYKFGVKNEKFGTPLEIEFANALSENEAITISVFYETNPNCSATQWLKPSQTCGKKHPYLFTQCQAIHARSLLPCQDSPLIKLTYSAIVRVPSPLVALMSALRTKSYNGNTNQSVFEFEQKTRIPSYLIALAVGALVGNEIGPRTTVWTEKEQLEQSTYEFVDTEDFIRLGEELLTPYDWGRYDLLVLPSSFPYGGMGKGRKSVIGNNLYLNAISCLTFITPTLLAGDRSLVNTVAHEVAHSWMGNLVTTANWVSLFQQNLIDQQHFWLNEGFTVFIERKILGRKYGEETRQFKSIIGLTALRESVEHFGAGNPLTALVPDLNGVDPDDSFSSVPYEKGYLFLYYLEELVGGPSVFEPFLKAHVREFAHKSITTNQWKDFFQKYFSEKVGEAKLKQIAWDDWLKRPGIPEYVPKYDRKLATVCEKLAEKWCLFDEKGGQSFDSNDFKSLQPSQKVLFLEKLIEKTVPLKVTTIAELNKVYDLSKFKNAEVRFRWQLLALKAKDSTIFPQVVEFVTEQGRMKYVRPLYRELFKANEQGRKLAHSTFKEYRNFYHPIAAQMIIQDIKYTE